MSASAGQNPVTATSYNIYGKLTAVSFGSLDSDAFTFDPNTGRMTQYQANVGSYSITGDHLEHERQSVQPGHHGHLPTDQQPDLHLPA